jgi:hypothetical protein
VLISFDYPRVTPGFSVQQALIHLLDCAWNGRKPATRPGWCWKLAGWSDRRHSERAFFSIWVTPGEQNGQGGVDDDLDGNSWSARRIFQGGLLHRRQQWQLHPDHRYTQIKPLQCNPDRERCHSNRIHLQNVIE